MNVFELTRALIDIDSVTNSEKRVGEFLFTHLSNLAKRPAGRVERMEVEPDRFNVIAYWGQPVVTLSTHMDTVPPFFPSREDEETIWGRGACDAKGIIAAMMAPVRWLLPGSLAAPATLLMVNPRRTKSRWAQKARCALKSPRRAAWPILL